MIRLSAFADEAGKELPAQIAALKRNAIPYIEVRFIGSKNVADLTLEEAKEVKAALDEGGIKVWSIGSPLGKIKITDDLDAHMEKTRHVCRLAKVLGTDKIRMVSFYEAFEARELVFETLRRMVAIAKEEGVCLYHENEKDIYGDTAERVKDVMENTKGLKFIYDPANYLQCGEKADDTLDMFHAKTDYFHIKDVVAASGAIVPAGCGDGKIAELVSRITSDKTLTLEPHLTVFEGYSHIDKTEMIHEYTFKNAAEAFDAAVNALKKILIGAGYQEIGNEFVK